MPDDLTPMMRQYRRAKGELPEGVILFFRLGDFYEMFFDDAKEAAPILDVALTKRGGVPMCGVPHHAVDSYLAKLIRAGRKVAICEQMEDPATARGIVRREITRVVTPGTVTEDGILDAKRHHFLAGVHREGPVWALALLDLSTGSFEVEEVAAAGALQDRLRCASAAECVAAASADGDPDLASALKASGAHVTRAEDWTFGYDAARDGLVRHFGVHSLEGFGCEGRRAAVGAAGAVLHYVKEDLRHRVEHVRALRLRSPGEVLAMDEATAVNLDLVPSRARPGSVSLLQVLDDTRTAMGARLLREWLLRPPAVLAQIVARHDAVEAFAQARPLLNELRESLGRIRDVERILTRLGTGGNPRDLAALAGSLEALPAVRAVLPAFASPALAPLAERVAEFPSLAGLLRRAVCDEPAATVREGGIIRAGYHAELDALRAAATEGRQWLAEYQSREIARTGIKTLKVRHNKVFGYYIEVSRGQSANVPADYARKQTLVGAERYITPELKEYENRVVGAQERAAALEFDLFQELRQAVLAETARIQACAQAVAETDVLACLASRALALRYVRPRMADDGVVRIRAGRHPVVEQMPDAERFVPNDTLLDCDRNQLLIITGPNMAGKSTYIRQVALIVILAHMGSFVPAAAADIGVVDRVFTRVGASDDLARGRSTFMVEMQETANILHHATPRSLIVLDEIGRGTSTFDGISIAWAVAEYLHNDGRVRAKTLFATHYHELTDLEVTLRGVKNYTVQVRESGDGIVFLRRIVRGGADKSYGIHVARLAGLPAEVIERAREILGNLEEGEFGDSGQPALARRRRPKTREDGRQMDLFQS